MAHLHAVGRAAVDHHDLVLAGNRHGVAVNRNDGAFQRTSWGVRHVAEKLARRLGQQAIADPHLLLGRDDIDRGGYHHVVLPTAAVPDVFEPFTANQRRLAQVLGLVPQHGLRKRVFQRPRIAKDPIVIVSSRRPLHQWRRGQTAGIRAVAARDQHAIFRRRHNARRCQQGGFVDNHRLGQKRFDQVRLQSRHGCVGCQRRDPRARRYANCFRRRPAPRVGGAAQPQQRAAIQLFQDQLLARVNPVRVKHLLYVHAPKLRPAPRALQEQAGDGPQGVAALDGVFLGRVRRKLGQWHSRLCHMLGR
jgi:hypothetical protein